MANHLPSELNSTQVLVNARLDSRLEVPVDEREFAEEYANSSGRGVASARRAASTAAFKYAPGPTPASYALSIKV
jgi:hypothetical protein